MSYTELFYVEKSGDVVWHSEYHNSHRGAGLVWHTMSHMYLFKEPEFFNLQPVWDLWENETVPIEMRIVMASTFDNVMIKRENLTHLVAAFRVYSAMVRDAGNIELQIQNLEKLADDENCLAVCWNQTSVNCGVWSVWIDDEQEYRPYNIFKDSKHWFLFEEIK